MSEVSCEPDVKSIITLECEEDKEQKDKFRLNFSTSGGQTIFRILPQSSERSGGRVSESVQIFEPIFNPF